MSMPPQAPTSSTNSGAPEHGPYTFIDAIKVGFAKYATFRGRARGSEFWFWVLFGQILSWALGGWTIMANSNAAANGQFNVGQSIGSLVNLVLFVPTIAVTVRRLHDVNRSGAWLVLPWLFFAAALTSVAVAFIRSAGNFAGLLLLDPESINNTLQESGGWLLGTAILGILGFLAYIPILVWLCADGGPNVPNKFGVRD